MDELAQRLINGYLTDMGCLKVRNLDRHPEYGTDVRCLLGTIRDEKTSSLIYRDAIQEFYRTHILREFLRTLQKRDRAITTGNNRPYVGVIYDNRCHIHAVDIPRAGTLVTETFINAINELSYLFGGKISVSKSVIDVKRIEEGTSLKHDVKRVTLPRVNEKMQIAILDQMIATGGTLCEAIKIEWREHGEMIDNLFIGSVIGAPDGIKVVSDILNHYKIKSNIVIGAIDEGLDERHYIVPGLGDAGDRTCWTTYIK